MFTSKTTKETHENRTRKQAWGELHCNVMHYITITLTKRKPCIKLQLQLHVFIKVIH